MVVMESELVLLATIEPRGRRSSSAAMIACFSSSRSGTASIATSAALPSSGLRRA